MTYLKLTTPDRAMIPSIESMLRVWKVIICPRTAPATPKGTTDMIIMGWFAILIYKDIIRKV